MTEDKVKAEGQKSKTDGQKSGYSRSKIGEFKKFDLQIFDIKMT